MSASAAQLHAAALPALVAGIHTALGSALASGAVWPSGEWLPDGVEVDWAFMFERYRALLLVPLLVLAVWFVRYVSEWLWLEREVKRKQERRTDDIT